MRRVARILVRVSLTLVLCAGLAELLLQAAALFVSTRNAEGPDGAQKRILCVGDSHTYGAGIPIEESYPHHLQKLLNQQFPGVYSVLNLGIPGMNTAQARKRLPDYVSRIRPEVVIVWVGVNNAWNWADEDFAASPWRGKFEALAGRSRLYRLIRVKIHDRNLERALQAGQPDEPWRRRPTSSPDLSDNYEIGIEGKMDRLVYHKREFRADRVTTERAARDYRSMADFVRSADVQLVLLTYPLRFGAFARANDAIAQAAKDAGIRVFQTWESVDRVPEEERVWLWAAHPSGPIYEQIARDLVPIVARATDG